MDLLIKYLTLFALSSENIKRPSINIIYEIMQKNFSEFVHKISNDERIKINIVGDKENIPIKIKKILFELEKLTKVIFFRFFHKLKVSSPFFFPTFRFILGISAIRGHLPC